MPCPNGKAILSRMTRRITAVMMAAALAAACSGREPTYDEEIAGWRAEKDQYMRSAESPVPAARRESFAPLPYFPVLPAYRVPARLELIKTDEIIEMSLSSGQQRRMRRVGVLGFTLQGQ